MEVIYSGWGDWGEDAPCASAEHNAEFYWFMVESVVHLRTQY